MEKQRNGAVLNSFVHICSGRVGKTFEADVRSRGDEIHFDPDSLAFGEHENEEPKTQGEERRVCA